MRIFINTFGSRGDVQPYIVLGKALSTRGHTVMVCTGSRFKSFVTQNGLQYAPITDQAFELLDTDKALLQDTMGIVGIVKTTLKTMKKAKPINRRMILDAWDAARSFSPQLVLSHPKALGAVSIAEKFDAPVVMISLIPMMAPTAQLPLIGTPPLKLGGWYNKLTYRLVMLGYKVYMKDLNDIRVKHMGLRKLPPNTGVVARSDGTPIPILHPISPHVFAPPSDWPDYYKVTGYLFMQQPKRWEPPAKLRRFIEEGNAPVYVGFGSMSGSNPRRLTTIIVNALQKADMRGIIASGWGGLEPGDLPDTILKIDHAPHDWLFPRTAAVVHHGGAGTTAASLRAGKPTVVCAFMGDQPFWGNRVHELGAGPTPLKQKSLTVEQLVEALRIATGDKKMRDKAAALGERIRAEDGIENAISVIEKLSK